MGAHGIVVFVSKEAKLLGWSDKTKVKILTVEDEEGKAIVIRKAE